jgi:hypothetical protein
LPHTLTVGQLIHQLQTLDPALPVYLAINPDWPFAHRVGEVVATSTGSTSAAYIAESGQENYLPPPVCTQLTWA